MPTAVDEIADEPEPPVRESAASPVERREAFTLLTSIFVIAACGLAYELLIATVSSYLLGNSVTQFSVSIGLFIGAMGLGSHLSQRIHRNLLGAFILTEIGVGMLGGVSVLLLFWSYAAGSLYWVVLYAILIAIGTLTGLELPLLTRILKRYGTLREVIAQAFSFDYIGALAGALLFPLVLLPFVGLARTGLAIGLLNLGVAAWTVSVFKPQLRGASALMGTAALIATAQGAGIAGAPMLIGLAESHLYEDEIIYSAQTPYQRIVITRWKDDLRLFLDGNLQFSSTDEYRYHEALIHPSFAFAPRIENVLMLGGGDGLAVREVLKYPTVRSVTLVDIDPKMTALGTGYRAIVDLNGRAMKDPRVRVVNADAYKFLENDVRLYDLIVSDLPDPNSDALAKLYSVEYYRLVKRRLVRSGLFVTQASSPFFSRDAFWCIARSMREAGLKTAPYHAYVPSFGDWGYILGSTWNIKRAEAKVGAATKFVDDALLREMFVFGKDSTEAPVEPSTLDHPRILSYYLDSSRQWE